MRLQFDKGGRRFFFLTFCVRGRSAVLSRIVEKVGRDGKLAYGVELTAAGEAMAPGAGAILHPFPKTGTTPVMARVMGLSFDTMR